MANCECMPIRGQLLSPGMYCDPWRARVFFWGGEGGNDAWHLGRRAFSRMASGQLVFKNSMIYGILQFTPSIAFCYIIHWCEILNIRCRESFWTNKIGWCLQHTMSEAASGPFWFKFLGTFCARVQFLVRRCTSPQPRGDESRGARLPPIPGQLSLVWVSFY